MHHKSKIIVSVVSLILLNVTLLFVFNQEAKLHVHSFIKHKAADEEPAVEVLLRSFLKRPLHNFLFDALAVTPERIESTRDYLHRAGQEEGSEGGCWKSNKVVVIDKKRVETDGSCWYNEDYKEITKRLPPEYHDTPFLVCDGDCLSSSPDLIVVSQNRRLAVNASSR